MGVNNLQAPRSELELTLAPPLATSHGVQFYDSTPFLVAAVGRFLSEGLLQGEPCVVVATALHCEGFLQHLEQNGISTEQAQAQGQLVVLDARELLATLMVEGLPEWERFQVALTPVLQRLQATHEGARIRAYGEMVDLLWKEGNSAAALQLEKFWTELGKQHAFSLRCAYELDHFRTSEDIQAFEQICRCHSQVLPSGEFSRQEPEDSRLRRISALEQRAFALGHEIEHRKRVEAQLVEAVRTREDFLSVAGHELKTPLTAMQLQMDSLLALAQKEGSPQLSGRLQRLRQQTCRLGSLVEDLLDVSRLSAGRFTLSPQSIDLAMTVREVVDRFAASASHNDCPLRVWAEGALEGHWDALRIEQVMSNLLTNAIKYGAGKPIEVTVLGTKSRVRLMVRDQGVGIPLRDQARIFQRFERASASRNYGGLGLGLWIVRQIVEAHGGTIRVESEPNEGATFTVELPRSF